MSDESGRQCDNQRAASSYDEPTANQANFHCWPAQDGIEIVNEHD